MTEQFISISRQKKISKDPKRDSLIQLIEKYPKQYIYFYTGINFFYDYFVSIIARYDREKQRQKNSRFI